MKAMDLLKYLDKADPAYIEEASDYNLLLYRKRRKRTRTALAACLALVVLAGVFLTKPALYAWEIRNTVASWRDNEGFVYLEFDKPSVPIFVSAELPDRKKFSADTPFTLSIGLGQVSDYEYATLSVKAHGFEITDKDGNTVTDRYVRTLSDFDSEDYGVLYRDGKPSSPVTGCQYLEDFTFRFTGSENTTGWGVIEFSLQSRNENSSMGDYVTVYYTIQNGVLKLTDKNPVRDGSQNGGLGAMLEETDAAPNEAKTVELSHEGHHITVTVTDPSLIRGEAWQDKIDVNVTLRGEPCESSDFMITLFPKDPVTGEVKGHIIRLMLPRFFSSMHDLIISADAPLGSYDMVVTWYGSNTDDEENLPRWVFEDFVTVTEPGTVTLSKEDFSIRVEMPTGALTPGQFLGDKCHVTAFYIPTQKDYPTDGFTAELVYAESLREKDFSFVIKKPVELDPSGDFVLALAPRVPMDAPIGSYDLRITDPATGYVWVFENAALILPADIPAYEDFIFEADTANRVISQGDNWPGGWDPFFLTLDGEDVAYQCRATLEYRTEQGGESYSITLMESMLSSYLPPDFVSVDAPAGMYDLVVTHTLYGYTWRAESFIEILENPEAERFGLYHDMGKKLTVSRSSGETYPFTVTVENRGDPFTVTESPRSGFLPTADVYQVDESEDSAHGIGLLVKWPFQEERERTVSTGETGSLSHEIRVNSDDPCGLYDLVVSYGGRVQIFEDVVEVVP